MKAEPQTSPLKGQNLSGEARNEALSGECSRDRTVRTRSSEVMTESSVGLSRRSVLQAAAGVLAASLAKVADAAEVGGRSVRASRSPDSVATASDPGPARQMEIYRGGLTGAKPAVPIAFEDLERKAQEAIKPEVFGYIQGSAGNGASSRANVTAFERWQILPRFLKDVSKRDLSVQFFGQRFSAPIMLAPIGGVLGTIHPDGEVAVARAARGAGIPMMLSTLSSKTMEAVAEALQDTPRWFQLYWPSDRDLTASFLQRAERSGYRAVVVTVDTKFLGWRETDLQNTYYPFFAGHGLANYFSDPVFRRGLRSKPEDNLPEAVTHWGNAFRNPTFSWADLKWLRQQTRLPILLKGILHPDDARKAVDHGAEGVVVSNHGGRQLHGVTPSLAALPGIAKAVGQRIHVLFDSGIRRGSDVFKALALGAKCVLLGRPYAYGLAVAGEVGVSEAIRNVVADFDLTLALAGCASIAELNKQYVSRV